MLPQRPGLCERPDLLLIYVREIGAPGGGFAHNFGLKRPVLWIFELPTRKSGAPAWACAKLSALMPRIAVYSSGAKHGVGGRIRAGDLLHVTQVL